ncbi:hypothetical protein BDV96DRAFT_500153 [Lophiotrema nucula]|uniref:Extracellular serine-rich protein n=1 Tax=Lophiotrema nucula TaxID=690887 RepID=A0A6A5YVG5_9PLEO|nr:hypothetical protein BDV96DRAFT_500153 [Lophiotrema nucula]
MAPRSLFWVSVLLTILLIFRSAIADDAAKRSTSSRRGNASSSARGGQPTSSARATALTKATAVSSSVIPSSTGRGATASGVATINNTILIFARDSTSSFAGYSILQGYGIPYQVVLVPSSGITLPQLNSSASHGNYGGIITLSELSYNYDAGYASALTPAQWDDLYAYQEAFNIRLVRLDVFPSAEFGVEEAEGGGTSVDQPIYISDASSFATAGLKTGSAAGMGTAGIFHSPATIVDSSSSGFTTSEVARFAAFQDHGESTAAVINDFGTREQMVWFLPWAPDWSPTSVFLSHAWVHWVSRGLYLGFRRTYFNTQIDDMFLETELYSPNGSNFRIDPDSISEHIPWMASINSRLPAGSKYVLEVGHNGNGNIEEAVDLNDELTRPNKCDPDSGIEYPDQIDTPLEFQKPLGTGTDIWPDNITEYTWSLECSQLDPLLQFWQNTSNLNAFYHISHTFSHEDEDNATYSDVVKEITWNQNWLDLVGISDATNFSPNGIIPPAITGLHNGDALQAWIENDIKWVVGDKTRPVLTNPYNEFWPLITNVSENGYDGMYVIGRWATTIYYNCDTPECTVAEWVATSAGTDSFDALLDNAKMVNSWHLLGLHWDPFMFHQANLRVSDVAPTTINGKTARYSLLQSWVETVITEMVRLVDWPFITLKHDDICQAWIARMTRDQCVPTMSYTTSADRKSVTGITVSASNQNCGATIPVTLPGAVKSAGTATKEQVGGDELTLWVQLAGKSQTFDFATPFVL